MYLWQCKIVFQSTATFGHFTLWPYLKCSLYLPVEAVIYMSIGRSKCRVWFGPDWVREKACASGKAINGNTFGFGANFLFRDNWFRNTLQVSLDLRPS